MSKSCSSLAFAVEQNFAGRFPSGEAELRPKAPSSKRDDEMPVGMGSFVPMGERFDHGGRGRIFARVAGLLGSLVGAAVLTGWWLNIAILKCIIPGAVPLKPNMGGGFLLCGIALTLLSARKWSRAGVVSEEAGSFPYGRLFAGVLSTLVLAMGALTLAEYFLSWDIGIDRWLVRNIPSTGALAPGRVNPVSALGFVLIGIALLVAAQRMPGRLRVPLVAGLSAASTILGILPLAGLCLESLLGPRWNFLGMSISGIVGATIFLILGTGLLALVQREGGLKWSLGGVSTAGFIAGVLLASLTTASAFNFARQMVAANTSVTHRQEVLKELQACMTGIAELLNSQRLYVILGEERLLNDRNQTKADLARSLEAIRELTKTNPNQKQSFNRLAGLVKQRIEWEERVLTQRREHDLAAAAQMIAGGTGIRLTEEIHGLLKEMEAKEYQLLGNDRKGVDMAAIATFMLLPFGVFVTMAVLTLAVFFLNAGLVERAQSETALRESQAQLQTIVENLDEGLVVSDLNGHLLHWNRAAARLHGYSDSEQDHRRFTDLIDTFELFDLQGTVVSVGQWPLARILRGENLRDLELCVRRVGMDWERIFSYGGTLVHDKKGRPLMAIVTIADITQRKQDEKMLRASEERYRELFESNPNPMWVYDLETLSFLAVNEAAVRHYGYSQDEFLAMTIRDIRSPEDIPALMKNLSRDTPGLDEVTEWQHLKKSGQAIDVEITSHDVVWLGRRAKLVLINDITERKRAENELRASLKEVGNLKTALDEHAIVAITDPQGKITYVNDKFCAISKYSREELLGQDHRIINSGHHPKEFIRDLWTTIGRGGVWKGEIKNRAKDGSYYWVDTTLIPFVDERGKPHQYVAIRADITERKQAEEELQKLNVELEGRVVARTAELETANKELEAFSYSVSHDLRAPLRAVDGFSQAVLEDYGGQLPKEGRKYLETIRQGAQRMGALIDDLLTFSRLSRVPLKKQPINTASLIREVLTQLRAQDEDRALDLRVGHLPQCHGDRALLKQVWINLISNALKYARKREQPVIEIGATSDNGQTVYFVSDNGVGFDMQYAHKLFGVFQRLHRAEEFEGTGVGLAIVQRIVHRHGGRVWAKAELDRGASFYFNLGVEAAVSAAEEEQS